MPLPTDNPVWPPADTRRARELYETWGAWYSGDPDQLAQVYGTGLGLGPAGRDFYTDPARAGILGRAIRRVVRFFWGQPATTGQAPSRVHVPLAGDIAEASAQLLFEELPRITVTQSQDRLAEILDQADAHARLLEAAELCAAYGGVYLRASRDDQAAGVPTIDVIAPDCAAPEWRHGRLAAVTFWRVVAEDHGQVWRHLERHEPGRILHGLYRGSSDRLGRAQPLTTHADTEDLAEEITTGLDGLACVYVPNVRPNRMLRGSPLGRSDFAGVEQLFDELDEVWSSWALEHRLGRARAIVPTSLLRSTGAGNGASFDEMQEFFTGLDMLPGADATPSQLIHFIQPELRVEEHARTCREITVRAVRSAGYSAATFGQDDDGAAATATEVNARKDRTTSTRARKIGYWRSPLADLVEILLGIDRDAFNPTTVPERPDIEWPDAVAVDPEALSRTLTGIADAEAASIRTRVAMLHPDWSGDQVDEEVGLILAERGTEADPFADVGRELAGNQLAPSGRQPEEDTGEA